MQTLEETKENCPVCGHKGVHETYEIGGNTGTVHSYGCNECGIFLSTLEEWVKLASQASQIRSLETISGDRLVELVDQAKRIDELQGAIEIYVNAMEKYEYMHKDGTGYIGLAALVKA